jgi:hypothetical protein
LAEVVHGLMAHERQKGLAKSRREAHPEAISPASRQSIPA